MKKLVSGSYRSMRIAAIVLSGIMVMLGATLANAAGGAKGHQIDRQKWTFSGFFGYYDQAQLQRGYQVYKEVCASCHGLKLLSYRNLSEKHGPGFTEDQVKVLAAEAEVEDGPNDEGEMFTRPGIPSDRFVSPFKNDPAARASNNGALPPDLSVIAKARNTSTAAPWYLEPVHWVKDITSGYQEGGPDYLYALLIGYVDAPANFKLSEGMTYNKYFHGNQIAMASPLSEGAVEYTDGSEQTVKQYAKDVSAFLMWTADPKLQERKKTGFRVLIYLIILSLILFFAKKRLWTKIEH